MRILVLSNLYPPHGIGGYELRCQQTVEALAARGHQVYVLTSNYQVEGQESTPAPSAVEIDRSLQIHGYYGQPWLPIHRLWTLERHNNARLTAAIERFQPEVVHVWNLGGISKSLLHRLEADSRPLVYDVSDHWIARSLEADVWLSWWNRDTAGLPSVIRRLLGASGFRSWLDRRAPTFPVSKLRFAHIYFCSAFLRNLTQNKGYPVGHGDVIYCAVDVPAFARKKTCQPLQRLLWVGRLAEDKDPLTAIRAVARSRDSDLRLDLFGKGTLEYEGVLQAEIQRLKLGSRVQVGRADHGQMRSLYAQYDALLFTSNWGEPFALTPLEAMAAGLPVIMCPDGGDAELARDGQNCLSFDAGDPDSLADAIDRFAALPDHGAALAADALAEVRQRFDLPVMVDQIEAVLQRAASAEPREA